MIIDTGVRFDSNLLNKELDKFIQYFGVNEKEPNQVCVTCRSDVHDPIEQLYEGVGRLKDGYNERDYNSICSVFSGSYFEDVMFSLPFPKGRTRIMRMPPRHCMSIHYDPSIRYHIALRTNRMAYILFKDDPSTDDYQKDLGFMYHLPNNGRLYKMDATKIHTAFNGGLEYRYHLVICS